MSQVTTITQILAAKGINIDEFTKDAARTDAPNNGVPRHTVTGLGIFDILMETATEHLLAQYEGNRIRAEHYADAYVQIYQATLQAALKIWLEKGIAEKQLEIAAAELALKEKQIPLIEKQIALLTAQAQAEDAKKQLYRRQIEGFDEDFKHKILKTLLDSWAVGFSVSKDSPTVSNIPSIISGNFITGVYNDRIASELANSTVRTS